MDPAILQLLVSMGLAPDATQEQIDAFIATLTDEQKATLVSAGWAPPAATAAAMSARTAGGNVAMLERQRVSTIRSLATTYGIAGNPIVNELIVAGLSVNDAIPRFRQVLSQVHAPIGGAIPGTNIIVGTDQNRASLSVACADALAIRGGTRVKQPHERARQFAGMSVTEMARRFYEHQGIDMTNVGRTQLARMVLNRNAAPENVRRAMLAQSTSDFDYVLNTAFNTSLRAGYQESSPTWQIWAKRGTLPDFTTGYRPILSAIGTPVQTDEGGEVKYQSLTDARETITLAKFTRGWRVTMEAVVNDRLGAFNDIAQKFGQACRRLEDDKAYAQLTSNPTVTQDSVALFHTSHSNYDSSGSALSVTALGAGRTKLAKQTGLKSEYLNLTASCLLVPVEIQTIAEQLVASLYDPAKSNDTANPEWIRSLKVVGEPRLSANSATAWYLTAPFQQCDGVEVAFLEDEQEPQLRQEMDFDTEDQKYAVRHCLAARALDYRPFYKNAGA